MEQDQELLYTLQAGLPLEEFPFQVIGKKLGIPENTVLSRAKELLGQKVIRRVGGIFESKLLGYSSLLCAADVAQNNIDDIAAIVSDRISVTHNYKREGSPNLWFTVTTRADQLEDELKLLEEALAPNAMLRLPAIKRFKIQVILDGRQDAIKDNPPQHLISSDAKPLTFSSKEQNLVRLMQKHIEPRSDFYEELSRDAGYTCDELLSILKKWKEAGALKRLGAILFHRQAGFSVNSMCVWSVPDSQITEKGQALAARSEVTHCYERPSRKSFPYNLYAMVHAKSEDEFKATFESIEKSAGLKNGQALPSIKEYKKTSPQFFYETEKEI